MSSRNRLPNYQQQQLRALAEEHGLSEAAKLVGINRQTYAILAAGFPANGTTVLGVRARLEELSAGAAHEADSREGR